MRLLNLCIFAVASMVMAAPSPTGPILEPKTPRPLSAAAWTKELAKFPPGHELTPEEMVQAWYKAHSANLPEANSMAKIGLPGPSERRAEKAKPGELQRQEDLTTVRCNSFPRNPSSVANAVRCVNYLSSKNKEKCEAASVTGWCQTGSTFILGWKKNNELSAQAPSCQSVAQAAARIIAECAVGGKVMGETATAEDVTTGVMIRDFSSGSIDKGFNLIS
ncbi:hypothetical protein C8035_v012345 [Colletotrichum spinosum]|uniref:Secreted protein n=1 Tax=Colletotrichum spinosum TaxID=1347390 RepID=A0A4R8Q1C2_9PEZI|nr:hypothetical protein C8035_v012345 [Colletotrichum spinosum]